MLAIGNPFGVGQTVTHGIVSALARTQVGITDYQFFIQTDAAINPGNSGGALVDMTGKLAGINTAIFSRSGGSQGIGFAIPANMVRVVVASAKSGGKAVKRPWLGARAAGSDARDRRDARASSSPSGRAGRQCRGQQSGGARRAETVRPDRRDRRPDRSTIPTPLTIASPPVRSAARADRRAARRQDREAPRCRWKPRPIPTATRSC